MRYLGIDYGTKRIGLAISDEGGTLAFPKEILGNDEEVLGKIEDVIKAENISEIVVGESMNFSGEQNKVAEEIETFISNLEKKFKIPVHKQPEFLTSVEARRYHEEGKVDASAAALILQRYLDKRNK